MAAISKSVHEQFVDTIRNSISLDAMDKGFQYDLKQLEVIFEQYREQLESIHLLVAQYSDLHRRLRIDLRSAQIKLKKQSGTPVENTLLVR